MWGSLLGLGLAAGGTVGFNAFKQHSAQSAMKKSFKYTQMLNEWQATKLPMLQKQGLVSAGYNPILAVNQGSPSIGGTISAQQASFDNPVSTITDAYTKGKDVGIKGDLLELQEQKQEKEMELLEEQIKNVQANTAKAQSEAKGIDIANVTNQSNSAKQLESNRLEMRKLGILNTAFAPEQYDYHDDRSKIGIRLSEGEFGEAYKRQQLNDMLHKADQYILDRIRVGAGSAKDIMDGIGGLKGIISPKPSPKSSPKSKGNVHHHYHHYNKK